jgi:hypothetical protein
MVAKQRVAIILFRDARASRRTKTGTPSIGADASEPPSSQLLTKHVACVVFRNPLLTIRGLVLARISGARFLGLLSRIT